MTYGKVKSESLKLMQGYSIAGTPIPSSYNNQADYLSLIPGLVDDAQHYIATTAKKIPATVPLSTLSKQDYGKIYMFTMPADCWQMSSAGLLLFNESTGHDMIPFSRYSGYKTAERNKFLLAKEIADNPNLTILVEYFRYPQTLGNNPADNMELDNAVETHYAIPYYVAAHLIMPDDYALYTTLYNTFEAKLARFGEIIQTERWQTIDVYDTSSGEDFYGY